MSRKTDSLADKVSRCLRSKELGKKHYARADALMAEIAKEIDPGTPIKLSGKIVTLVDRFADREIVWTPCAARPYELKVTPA